MGRYRIIQGDVREELGRLPGDHFHAVVTSPPYFGLRDYRDQTGGVPLGLEPSPQAFVRNLVDVFHEVRRVLRPDGICWVNIGDSYARDAGKGQHKPGNSGKSESSECQEMDRPMSHAEGCGLKPKDQCLVPERLVLALQDDGWWIRRVVIWHKPNAKPSSVKDRPIPDWEYVYMLTKSERYFYDWFAMREPAVQVRRMNTARAVRPEPDQENDRIDANRLHAHDIPTELHRSLRSVWSINTKPLGLEMCLGCGRVYSSSEFSSLQYSNGQQICPDCLESNWLTHFAAFPVELPERCLKASLSEKGCCGECGATIKRIVEREFTGEYSSAAAKRQQERSAGVDSGGTLRVTLSAKPGSVRERAMGWEPTCTCFPSGLVYDHPGFLPTIKPCRVLDPFSGAGSTGVAALRLGAEYTGIDLNKDYCRLAEHRLAMETV